MRLSVKGDAIDLLYPAQWKSIWLRVNETEMKILLNLRRFFFLRENDLYYDTSCNKYPREPAQKWGKGGKSDSWLAALCSRRFNWFDLCRRRPARKTLLSQGWKLKLGNIDEIQKDFTVRDDKGWNTAYPTDISNILVMKSQIWSSNVEHTMISYMLYL